uniref:Uncharacterized protein n=1 Tax=Brassica oleracea var. oleracea TaxID=109376 RepID=A0A0D3D868_BRAOL
MGLHRDGETDEPEPVEAPATNHRKQPPLLLLPEVQKHQDTPTTQSLPPEPPTPQQRAQ